MSLHGSSAKSQVHAQPMEITIRTAIWEVPSLLSAHWVPKRNKFPSVLSLCSGKDTQFIMAQEQVPVLSSPLPPGCNWARFHPPAFPALAELQRDNITPAEKWCKIALDKMSCKMLKRRGKGRKIHPRIFCHARAKIHLSNYSRAYKASLTFKHQRITELQYLINLHFFFYD